VLAVRRLEPFHPSRAGRANAAVVGSDDGMSLSLLGGRVGTFSEKVAEESSSMVPFNVDYLRVQIEGDTVNVRNRCV
jgi:hypothetical protein